MHNTRGCPQQQPNTHTQPTNTLPLLSLSVSFQQATHFPFTLATSQTYPDHSKCIECGSQHWWNFSPTSLNGTLVCVCVPKALHYARPWQRRESVFKVILYIIYRMSLKDAHSKGAASPGCCCTVCQSMCLIWFHQWHDLLAWCSVLFCWTRKTQTRQQSFFNLTRFKGSCSGAEIMQLDEERKNSADGAHPYVPRFCLRFLPD